MRIGLVADGLAAWAGGRDLLRGLYESLTAVLPSGSEVALVLWSPPEGAVLRLARIAKHVVLHKGWDRNWVQNELWHKPRKTHFQEILGSHDPKFVRVADLRGRIVNSKLASFDVMGPFMGVPAFTPKIPLVGYIPDCQHHRLPEFFSPEEIRDRDKTFSDLLAVAPVTIVTSEDAKSDLHRYFGPFRSEVVSLPFGSARAGPDPQWLGSVDNHVLRRYAIDHSFFLCSNQFWLHKNHKVVFEAIALAGRDTRPINVVFTGPMEDYRDPAYITELLRYVDTSGARAHCRFLGLIPKLDQIQLMKAAIGVVQPTLFEGSPGGGAFEEAASLGRPTIVSDIPVNREASEHVTEFFAPGSPQSLLAAMRRVEANPPVAPSRDSLIAGGEARLRRCGCALLAAFLRAIEISKTHMAA